MSRENVEVVRALQPRPEVDIAQMFRDEALVAALIDGAAPLFHPDFETVLDWPHGRSTYNGFDGLRLAWLDWLQPWASYRTETEELIDAGDKVVILVRDYGRREGMDREVGVIGAAVWTFRTGKVARIEFHPDRARALRSAGLPG